MPVSYHGDEEVEDAHPAQLGLNQRYQVLTKGIRMRYCFVSTTLSNITPQNKAKKKKAYELYLSASSPDATSSVHYAGDSGQSLLASPERLLPAQVS